MKIINDIIPGVWPMIIIICVIVVSLRVAYLMIGKKKFNLYEEVLGLIFIIYVLCLFHVVSYQDVNYGTNNIIPFKEMFRYDVGSYKFFKNILGNIILFMPYGFFVNYYLKTKKIYPTLILSAIVSFTIESVQYYIGRVFDIDDIILNVVGAIIGYFLYKLFKKLTDLIKGKGMNYIIIIVIIVLVIIFLCDINIFSLLKGWLLCLI